MVLHLNDLVHEKSQQYQYEKIEGKVFFTVAKIKITGKMP
jgi:hypothetical protein